MGWRAVCALGAFGAILGYLGVRVAGVLLLDVDIIVQEAIDSGAMIQISPTSAAIRVAEGDWRRVSALGTDHIRPEVARWTGAMGGVSVLVGGLIGALAGIRAKVRTFLVRVPVAACLTLAFCCCCVLIEPPRIVEGYDRFVTAYQEQFARRALLFAAAGAGMACCGKAAGWLLQGLPRLWPWWRRRPCTNEVEHALHQACAQGESNTHRGWRAALEGLSEIKGTSSEVSRLVAVLTVGRWYDRFVTRHALARLGGEAAQPLLPLLRSPEGAAARATEWVLRSIAEMTHRELGSGPERFLCPNCLTRPGEIRLPIPRKPDSHYLGCRECGRSRGLQEWPGQVIAVLDEARAEDRVEQDDALLVNWPKHGKLFDFDAVWIVSASNEDVERFAMAAGNDTDEIRRPRYQTMRCAVSPECNLSENTMRILRSTFGEIEVVHDVH